jgi:hypothetical protein
LKYVKKLSETFVSKYKEASAPFGPVGYVTYKRTYARQRQDEPRTEEWFETVQRVVGGILDVGGAFTQDEIETLYHYIFNLKCFPGGRGLWQLGTSVIQRVGADSLQNCWHVAIDDPIEPFCFAFNQLMLGGGVGFNITPQYVYSLPEVKYDVDIVRVDNNDVNFIVPDNREGWVELLKRILESFFFTGQSLTYSTNATRARGKPIKTFGGTASGSEDLVIGLGNIVKILKSRVGQKLRPLDCLDILNIIGTIVVAGNVRRSAEIALGDPLDPLFLDAKNWNKGHVPDWRQMSNNSVIVDDIGILPETFWSNYNGEGEPCGLFNLANARRFGRVADGINYRPDHRVVGVNPCSPGWATVLTPEGIRTFDDIDVGSTVWSGTRWTKVVRKLATGIKPVFEYVTYAGSFIGTEDHRVVQNGIKVQVKNAKTIDVCSTPDFSTNASAEIYKIFDHGLHTVYDITVDSSEHTYWSGGLLVSNCGEITLEPYESCVSGDTRIQTDRGCPRIKDVVGQEVDVWNGRAWSKVTPRITGYGRELFRVTLSDGSYVDCTSNHGWEVVPPGKSVPRRVDTLFLEPDSKLPRFSLGTLAESIDEPYAYEWGLFGGDGYLDKAQIMLSLYKSKMELTDLGIAGRVYQEQFKEDYQSVFTRVNLTHELDYTLAKELNDKYSGIPDYFFQMSKKSTLEFLAGFIDTDGNIANKGTSAEGYRIYGGEAKLRDLQLLARRAGIDNCSLNLISQAGTVTNFGTRNYSLFCLQVCSSDCASIPTRLKTINKFGTGKSTNNAYPDGEDIDRNPRQRVRSVELLPGMHTTYCFDEPERHMGVFGNALTYQCNLVELVLPNLENINEFALAAELMFKVGKVVSCIPFSHPKTQEVVDRNHRIGVGVTGVLQALHYMEPHVFDTIYRHVEETDRRYSKILGVDESIKLTTVKPSGTLSLLPGVTPGVHPAFSDYYIRRIRFASDDPLVPLLKENGYHIEPRRTLEGGLDFKTMVAEFPVATPPGTVLADEISAVEQLEYASFLQTYWSDNSVSVTVYYSEEELPDIRSWLTKNYNDGVKSVSFLLRSGHGFKQAPLEAIPQARYNELIASTKTITRVDDREQRDLADGLECAGGFCPIK